MPNWIKIYEASQRYIRARASSGLFVAAVYVVIGLLGLFLLANNQPFEIPVGILFFCIGLVGSTYLGYLALQEWTGQPIVLTVRVVSKQDVESYGRMGVLHRYYVHVMVQKAVRLSKDGDLVLLERKRLDLLPVSDRMFDRLSEGETTVIVCTPTGIAFSTLDELEFEIGLYAG